MTKNSTESSQLWETFKNGIGRLNPQEQNKLFNNPNFPHDKVINEYKQIDFHTKLLMSLYVKDKEVINLLSQDSEQSVREALLKNPNIDQTESIKILQNSTELDMNSIINNKVLSNYCKEYAVKELLSPKKAVSQWLYESLENPLHIILNYKQRMSQNVLDINHKLIPQYQKLLNVAMFEMTSKNTLNRINQHNETYTPYLVDNFLVNLFLEAIKKAPVEKDFNEYISRYIDKSKYSEIWNVLSLDLEDEETVYETLSLNISFMNNYVLINSENIGSSYLDDFAEKEDVFTQALVASHHNTQSSTLDYLLFNSSEDFIRYEVLHHPRFNNSEYIDKLVNSKNITEQCDAALLCNLSIQQMVQLFEENIFEISSRLLLNKSVPNSLKSLYQNC